MIEPQKMVNTLSAVDARYNEVFSKISADIS